MLENALTDTFLSVTDLAEKAGVSEATVIRFCQRSVLGFLEFKKAFLQDRLQTRTEPSPYSKITAADEPDIILQKVFAILKIPCGALQNALTNPPSQKRWNGSRMRTSWSFMPTAVPATLPKRRHSIPKAGLKVRSLHRPLGARHGHRTRPEDVVVGISHTGETLSVVEAIKTGRKRGLRTIAVTNFPQSALAQSAEVVILTATNDPALFSDAGASRVSQIAALDAIGVAVSVRKRESN